MTPPKPIRKQQFQLRKTLASRMLAAALLCCLCGPDGMAQAHPTEADVKAAYLVNFGKFVRYPDAPSTTFDICLVGHDPVAPMLESGASDESIENHPVHIKQFDKAADARGCAIVFMGVSEAPRVEKDLAALQGSNALTVSDLPQFIDRGGMIQFVVQDNRVRFAVNLSSAVKARLALSSELLKVALYVNSRAPQEAP
jgi:hypothetical protein